MKTLNLENCWRDDNKLRQVFSWLTRINAGRKFGTLPISWYQAHQCHCIDKLTEICGTLPLRCKQGQIQFRSNEGWKNAISVFELFNYADNKARS